MSEQTPDLSPEQQPEARAGRASMPRRPRWVLVAGIIAIVLTLMVVVLLLTGGEHGPGRHIGSGDGARLTVPSSMNAAAQQL